MTQPRDKELQGFKERKALPKGMVLLGGGLIGVGVAKRKCVTVGAGFTVSYAQAIPSVIVYFLLPADQDVELSHCHVLP